MLSVDWMNSKYKPINIMQTSFYTDIPIFKKKTEKNGIIFVNPGALCASPYPEYAEITINEKNIKINFRKLH